MDHVVPVPAGPTSITNLTPLCPGDHNGKTHGGWVHVLDPESGTLTQTSPSAAVTPPRRPRRSRPLDVAATHPTCGLGSLSIRTMPTSPLGNPHRIPPSSRRPHRQTLRLRWTAGPTSPRPSATEPAPLAATSARNKPPPPEPPQAAAAEQALIHQLHAELDAATDYQLITAINTEYLTEDNAA